MAYAPPEDADLSGFHVPERHSELGLSGENMVAMWRAVLLSRRLDQKIWALNRMGKAPFAVSCQGQEGCQVATGWALRAGNDVVLPYYRDTGLMVALGMTPLEIFQAVFAREADPSSGGRQMPNHWGSSRLRVITGSSPIATQIPHAAGIALAARMRGEDTAVVTLFGDGAASKGDFHEAMNFAGIHALPMVAICENNGYAVSVPLSKESAIENIAEHARQYRFTGVIVDGNDALDVYAAVHAAVVRARKGEGPTLIEAKTYRYLSHTSDDDDRTYRTPAEVETWRKKDPLGRLKQYLIEQRLLSEATEAATEEEVAAEIEEAVRAAEASPPPVPGDAFRKVYAKPLRPIAGVPAEYASSQDGIRPPALGAAVPDDAPVKTLIESVRESIDHAMAADERVFVLGEDVGNRGGVFKATEGLIVKYGEARVLDTPLAESAIVGVAIGAAVAGLLPIAEIQFADFIHPAFDQIVSEAARIHYRSNGDFNVPLVIRAPYGGGVHGALYHSQSVESLFAHVPGLKVVCPSTPADIKGMLLEAIADPDPVLFFEHKKAYRSVKGPVPEGDWRVPLGVATVARPGTDATIVTYGLQRHLAVEAAELLQAEGIGNVEVVDLRTISPLDRDTVLASARKTGRVLVVSEDNISFSVAAEVARPGGRGGLLRPRRPRDAPGHHRHPGDAVCPTHGSRRPHHRGAHRSRRPQTAPGLNPGHHRTRGATRPSHRLVVRPYRRPCAPTRRPATRGTADPHVTLPISASARRGGLVAHRSPLRAGKRCTVSDVPATVPARTLVDCAQLLDAPALMALVDSCLCRRLTTPARVEAAAGAASPTGHRPGIPLLRHVMSVWTDGIQPGRAAEMRLLRRIDRWGLPHPVKQFEVCDGTGAFVARIDLAWPDLRRRLEYDGQEFHGPRQWEADEARHARLVRLGWWIERVEKVDLIDGATRLREILAAMLLLTA